MSAPGDDWELPFEPNLTQGRFAVFSSKGKGRRPGRRRPPESYYQVTVPTRRLRRKTLHKIIAVLAVRRAREARGMTNIRNIAQALGGDVAGRDSVLAPGPGHSPGDRSCKSPSGATTLSYIPLPEILGISAAMM